MKILGIGESVIDNVIIKDRRLETTEQHVGGPVPVGLILLSRLGMECTLITSLGNDSYGNIIQQTLQEEQVQVITHKQERTKIHTIIVDAQTGQREKKREAIKHRPITHLTPAFLRQFDLILLDRHEKEAFYEIIAKKNPTTTLLVDTSTEISDFTIDMLRHATYPIVPIEALLKVNKKKHLLSCLKTVQKLSSKPLIATAGELGSLLFDGEKMEIIPSLSIKTIDTTGAGDIFRGAFAFGILQDWDIHETIQFANLVAALQCTKVGNVAAIPTKQEIALCRNLVIQKKSVKRKTITNYFQGLEL